MNGSLSSLDEMPAAQRLCSYHYPSYMYALSVSERLNEAEDVYRESYYRMDNAENVRMIARDMVNQTHAFYKEVGWERPTSKKCFYVYWDTYARAWRVHPRPSYPKDYLWLE